MKLLTTFVLASAAMAGAPAWAQANTASQRPSCSSYQLEVSSLTAQLPKSALWDDATIARAKSSLAKLEASRQIILRLTRRLSAAEVSASNADAFDKSGEANFWRRDAIQVRSQIDNEKRKAKALSSDAGVSCPGCTYSALIAKVRASIDGAVAARTAAYGIEQRIVQYKSAMAAAGC